MELAQVGGTLMATNRDPKYMNALTAFQAVIASALAKMNGLTGTAARGKSVSVYVSQGRKADKLMLANTVNGKVHGTPTVLYFIDLATGNIFGPKSPIAANKNWWYGDVYNVGAWNFDNPHNPEPRNKANFRAVKSYGDKTHYLPIGMRKRLSERASAMPKSAKAPKAKRGRKAAAR